MPSITQKISPCLWFDDNIEEAVKFYCSIFPNSKILSTSRYSKNMPRPEGSMMMIAFELDGQQFSALNGGPNFKFTEAISLVIACETQEEIDYFWEKLREGGGQEIECGWLKDKFGLFWQVWPKIIGDFISDRNPARSERVMQAVMKMKSWTSQDCRRPRRKKRLKQVW